MKKILTLTLCCLTAFTAQAQKLTISKSTIDVGKTAYEVPITGTFELKYKGPKSIVITDVKADCGCTKTVWPKKSISSGEKFTISMTYDARMLGHFNKQIAVYCKTSGRSAKTEIKPVYLKMKGIVLAEPTAENMAEKYPYDLNGLRADVNNLEFDDVNKGDVRQAEFNIYNNSSSTITPNMLHLPPYLSAKAIPEKLSPYRTGKMIVTLNSQKVYGMGLTQTSVYLASTLGESIRSEIEIPVSVVLLPDMSKFDGNNKQYAPKMQLSANQLTLDAKHKRGVITITNQGRTPLKISSMQLFTKGVKVQLNKSELQPGEVATLKAKVYPNDLKKVRSRPRILMITNDPDHAKVVISINYK
ncbi:DUF1573 domain-containing protein [Prevotella sp. E13-17]|uniref:DUF1573 domain-containing protein n=1 Tax=Prevotella sp. E13-17 TaxID=2913616 RepID=UPI001ED9D6A0|nr:DUF1573 domain-containing protein [Prevotella sp. E13-17]UKK51580.1 DUF1573 domain-containing protein [Prevotella sp. E13-17]